MNKDKEITKSWIEKKIHEKAVKRYENEINQAFKLSKDSVVGKLFIGNIPKDYWLNSFKRVSSLYNDASKERSNQQMKKEGLR